MLNLICHIEIKDKDTKRTVSFDYASSIKVITSLESLTDTAEVILPDKARWKQKTSAEGKKSRTAKSSSKKTTGEEKTLTDYIKKGNEITIQAGYAEYGMETIFKGYITKPEIGSGITINCKDEMWKFEDICIDHECEEQFNLKNFIEKYSKDAKVEIADDVKFGRMDFDDEMYLIDALEEVRKSYSFVRCYFQDDVFYATYKTPHGNRKPVVFDYARNIIPDSSEAAGGAGKGSKTGVVATSMTLDNKKMEARAPQEAFNDKKPAEGYSVQIIDNCTQSNTQEELQAYTDGKASEANKKEIIFTAFGVPYVRKGDVVELRGDKYNGEKFLVEAVDYTFGSTSGYRQKITLGYEVKDE